MEAVAQKIAIRDQMRAKLAGLTDAAVRAASAAIWERLARLPEVSTAERLLIYVSKGHEVDTHGLIQQMLAVGKHVSVPRFDDATNSYSAAEVRDFHGDLALGKFGILEPKSGASRVAAFTQLQLLLVPGLAFDEQGNRLGRGMGFFDRILTEAPATKVALAYDFQVLKEVPVEAHDAGMDFIVTETRVIKIQGNTNQ